LKNLILAMFSRKMRRSDGSLWAVQEQTQDIDSRSDHGTQFRLSGMLFLFILQVY